MHGLIFGSCGIGCTVSSLAPTPRRFSAWSLVKSCSLVLMQGSPIHINIPELRAELRALPQVVSVHELHVWQLTGSVVVASVHVVLSASPSSPVGINTVTKRIKQVLHRFVHGLCLVYPSEIKDFAF
jgi:Co/Zn/Cd efflux system component